jgi:hypothetical protein
MVAFYNLSPEINFDKRFEVTTSTRGTSLQRNSHVLQAPGYFKGMSINPGAKHMGCCSGAHRDAAAITKLLQTHFIAIDFVKALANATKKLGSCPPWHALYGYGAVSLFKGAQYGRKNVFKKLARTIILLLSSRMPCPSPRVVCRATVSLRWKNHLQYLASYTVNRAGPERLSACISMQDEV